MNLSPRRREDPEVNLTPLIDVVFLMLIFFMVSTTFLKQANLQVSLPKASQKPTPEQSEPIELTINAKGSFFVNGKTLVNDKVGTVQRALADALGKRSADHTEVVIRADGRTQHQLVVTAMDAAQRAGLVHVGIATVPRKEP